MKELDERESLEIKGGGVAWWIPVSIGIAIVFAIGVWSGYTNPQKCN